MWAGDRVRDPSSLVRPSGPHNRQHYRANPPYSWAIIARETCDMSVSVAMAAAYTRQAGEILVYILSIMRRNTSDVGGVGVGSRYALAPSRRLIDTIGVPPSQRF